MENIYLKLKHWQLFLLLIFVAFLNQIALMPILFSKTSYFLGIIGGIVGGIGYLFFIGWYYIIIKGLNKKIENPAIKVYKNYYLFFLLFPAAYIGFIFSYLSHVFSNVQGTNTNVGLSMLFIIPLHFFSMFCIFFLMYKAARTIKTVELQRRISFGDFAGEFFLLWFSPIGIWILQPKINKFAS